MYDASCRSTVEGLAEKRSRSTSQEGAESRLMILTGMMLIGAVAMQCAIFAIVLLGGRGALVAIGSAVSWIAVEAWRVGGDATIPLATCILAACFCLALVALHRSHWIELPRRVYGWLHRALGLTGSAALLMCVTRAI